MKSILALTAAIALAISAPAFAQSAGTPGAIGDTGSAVGHNTPGGGVDKNMTTSPNDGMQNSGAMKKHEGRAASPDAPAGEMTK
jgi:hypothetical protein